MEHFIRKAKKLYRSTNVKISNFGDQMLSQLQLLSHYAEAPPAKIEWNNILLTLYLPAHLEFGFGQLGRKIGAVIGTLYAFSEDLGVEPTNNRAEWTLSFGVIWHNHCFGS